MLLLFTPLVRSTRKIIRYAEIKGCWGKFMVSADSGYFGGDVIPNIHNAYL